MPVIQLEPTRSVSLALAAAYDKRALGLDADKRTIAGDKLVVGVFYTPVTIDDDLFWY